MKKRRRILRWILAIPILLILGLALALRYETACPSAAAQTESPTGSRAVTYVCYGGPEVLRVTAVPQPTPDSGQIVVAVKAAAVNPLDWHEMRGKPYLARLSTGFFAPSSPLFGTDFAGIVTSVGRGVTRFTVGDSVFGMGHGAFARHLTIGERRAIARMPSGVSFEDAAAAGVAAITALQALRDKGGVARESKVLVNGASGGVGTYAVQMARAMGAHVTGVASTRNMELVKSLGADEVIDYTKENFTEGTARYDVIIDMVGNHPLRALRRVMTETGRVVPVGGPEGGAYLGPLRRSAIAAVYSMFVPQSFKFFLAVGNPADMETISGMLGKGSIRSVIDRRYPVEKAAEAIEYLERGRARGKVVLTVDAADSMAQH